MSDDEQSIQPEDIETLARLMRLGGETEQKIAETVAKLREIAGEDATDD